MPVISDIPNGSIDSNKFNFNIQEMVNNGASVLIKKALDNAVIPYYELTVENDGDTYIEIPEDARQYFSTDDKRATALLVLCGIEMPQSVFDFHENGEGIVWSVLNGGKVLETIDSLILKIKSK